MFLFLEGFQPQNYLTLFLISVKYFYLLTVKITPVKITPEVNM